VLEGVKTGRECDRRRHAAIWLRIWSRPHVGRKKNRNSYRASSIYSEISGKSQVLKRILTLVIPFHAALMWKTMGIYSGRSNRIALSTFVRLFMREWNIFVPLQLILVVSPESQDRFLLPEHLPRPLDPRIPQDHDRYSQCQCLSREVSRRLHKEGGLA